MKYFFVTSGTLAFAAVGIFLVLLTKHIFSQEKIAPEEIIVLLLVCAIVVMVLGLVYEAFRKDKP